MGVESEVEEVHFPTGSVDVPLRAGFQVVEGDAEQSAAGVVERGDV